MRKINCISVLLLIVMMIFGACESSASVVVNNEELVESINETTEKVVSEIVKENIVNESVAKEVDDNHNMKDGKIVGEVLGMNDYGFKINSVNKELLKALYDIDDKNVIFSNSGIMSVLAMANLAAGGETKKQITDFIGDFDKDLNSEAVNIYNFMTLNNLNKTFEVKETFVDGLKNTDFIKAGVYEIDENNDADSVANVLNKKIEMETNGQIKNGIDPKVYKDKLFVAQLGNVIHFKGRWANLRKGQEYDTSDYNFTGTDGKDVLTKFVIPKDNDADLIENDTLIGFSLDYKEDDNRYKFVALLPKDEMLDEGKLNIEKLDLEDLHYYDEMEYILDAKFPAFEFDSDMSFTKMLQALGVKDVFDMDKANLTNGFVIKDKNIYASDCHQKAVIKVDECGTEASALTTMTMLNATAIRIDKMKTVRYVTLTFNRPFIYMIYDNVAEMPLFIGAIKNLDGKENVDGIAKVNSIVDEIMEVTITTSTKGKKSQVSNVMVG